MWFIVGAVVSALPLKAWPAFLVANAMSWPRGSGSWEVCQGSWFGFVLCLTTGYPALYGAALITGLVLVRWHRRAAAAVAWAPLIVLVTVLLLTEPRLMLMLVPV